MLISPLDALKWIDALTDGRVSDQLKRARWYPVRRRELATVRDLLQVKLKRDGYRLDGPDQSRFSLSTKEGLAELSDSFSISIRPHLDGYTAHGLMKEIVRLMQEEGRDAFSLTAEPGDGKAVLGMLLPLLYQRSRQCAVLYLSPTDWTPGVPRVKERAQKWLESWPSEQHRLLVIDSANERLFDPEFKSFVTELRQKPQYVCGFLFLFRPAAPGKTGNIALALEALFGRPAREIRIHFDPAQAVQCRFFRHLFPAEDLNEYQLSYLLLAYQRLFPGYTLTRFSAVLVLRHLIETFRGAAALQEPRLPVSPPGDVIFDRILFSDIDLDHPTVKRLSQVALGMVKAGSTHVSITDPESLADELRDAKSYLKGRSAISLEIDGGTVWIPNELHVRALAALELARMISTGDDPLSPGLRDLFGRSRYDSCAPFLLAAYRRIGKTQGQMPELERERRQETLYKVLASFLGRDNAPFSFCARLIHSNHEFSLISRERIEALNRALFQRLVQAIDLDRRTTCDQSIRDAPGPNPLLDQLFEVVAAYEDTVVQLLVDHVLLTSKEDLEKSQGAYLILAWLNRLLSSKASSEALLARRHHVYTILNGLEVLHTENLHVRFHVVEVLDALAAHRETRLKGMPGLEDRLQGLLKGYELAPEPPGGPRPDSVYAECNALVSTWAAQILGAGPSAETLRESDEKVLLPLLKRFEELLHRHEIPLAGGLIPQPIGKEDLEVILECYEVLLGLTRRAYVRDPRLVLRSFIDQASNCPFWIVRWWAFYNMYCLVLERDSVSESDRMDCLSWMLDRAYREGEPIGLKHRQVALLENLAEQHSVANNLLRQLFETRAPLDEARVTAEYSKIRGRGHSGELEEYFSRLRRLRFRYH